MNYGLSVPNFGAPKHLIAMAVAAERAGWDGYFLWDHVVYRRRADKEMVDPWIVLGAIAAATSTIKLGTLITPVSRRRPWKLAREAGTLDVLSNGRFIFGVGLGNPPDADFEHLGEEADDKRRAEMLDEGLEVIAGLWSGAPFDHEGEHYKIVDTLMLPTPVQSPRIPVWVAGVWPNKPPFRRAAKWDGVVPIKKDTEGFQRMTPDDVIAMKSYMDSLRTGGAPYDIVISGWTGDDPSGAPQKIAPFTEAGTTWWLESPSGAPGWQDDVSKRIQAGPPT